MKVDENRSDSVLKNKLTDEENSYIVKVLGRKTTKFENEVLSHLWCEEVSHKNADFVFNSIPTFRDQLINHTDRKSLNFVDIKDGKSVTAIIDEISSSVENEKIMLNEISREFATCGADYLGSASYAQHPLDTKKSFFALGLLENHRPQATNIDGIGNPVYLLVSNSNNKFLKLVKELSGRSYVLRLKTVIKGGIIKSCVEAIQDNPNGINLNLDAVYKALRKRVSEPVLFKNYNNVILTIITKGFEKEFSERCRSVKVANHLIGEINTEKVLQFHRKGESIGEIPVSLTSPTSETLEVSHRVLLRPEYLDDVNSLDLEILKKPKNLNRTLLNLFASIRTEPNKTKKSNRPSLYDFSHQLSVKGKYRNIIASVKGNDRFLYLEPSTGGKSAVAEAVRNIVCSGATPVLTANYFRFGDLNDPTVYYQFREAVSGIGEACKVLNLPIVANRLNLESENYKNPEFKVGVAGLLKSKDDLITPNFKDPGDFILIFGSHRGELGGSDYLNIIHKRELGPPPAVDLLTEVKLQELIQMANDIRMIKSAYPVSKGGLSIAIVNCILASTDGIGARIHMSSKIRDDELLFGETQGLIVATVEEDAIIEIERICMRLGIPCTAIGRVTDTGKFTFNDIVSLDTKKLMKASNL